MPDSGSPDDDEPRDSADGPDVDDPESAERSDGEEATDAERDNVDTASESDTAEADSEPESDTDDDGSDAGSDRGDDSDGVETESDGENGDAEDSGDDEAGPAGQPSDDDSNDTESGTEDHASDADDTSDAEPGTEDQTSDVDEEALEAAVQDAVDGATAARGDAEDDYDEGSSPSDSGSTDDSTSEADGDSAGSSADDSTSDSGTDSSAEEGVEDGVDDDADPIGEEYGESAIVSDDSDDGEGGLFGSGDGPAADQEMPITAHVEEMVKRLAVVIAVAGIVSAITFPFAEPIINFLWNSVIPADAAGGTPRPRLYGVLELWFTKVKVASLAGLIVALPVLVYETYRFMRPGLYPHERRYYLAAVPTSLVLAIVGVAFAYFIVLPGVFGYFLYYSADVAEIGFALGRTFNLILIMMAYLAIVFQIPLFLLLAMMMGLVTRQWLADRRLLFWGAFLGISFVFSPDPTGMVPILVALTMVGLFEGTLLLTKWTQNRRGGGGDTAAA